jgi:F-type H+-transporting ATPase subunit b
VDILGILGSVGFDWRVALANLVNFILIYFLLDKFVFKPLAKTLDERKLKIEEGLGNIERAENLMVEAQQERESLLEETKKERNKIIEEARIRERALIEEANLKAKKEADAILDHGVLMLEKERKDMERKFNEAAIDIVVAGVKKVTSHEIDEKINNQIVEKILKKDI